MKTLYMLKGLPACGKSTIAKEMQETNKNLVRVNKDSLRELLHNGEWSGKNEKTILKMRDHIIRESLMAGKSVIVDDTNLAPKHEQKMKELSGVFGAELKIIDMTDVTPEVCIKRDLKRANSVGQKVILGMYHQFIRTEDVSERKLDPMIFNEKLDDCVIFDLDGTLAHITGRSPYDGKSCASDQVNESISFLLWALHGEQVETNIILLSGRNGESRPETEKWLADNGISYTDLFMRAPGDSRKDSIIKEELFNENIRDKYNVLFVVDDRKQVVDLWRSMGLTCLQCAPGNF